MRLQKALTKSGVASRREAEAIIQEGRVTVNNKTVYHPAHEIEEGDKVAIDGGPVTKSRKTRLLCLQQAKGTYCRSK